MPEDPTSPPLLQGARQTVPLATLFGAMYFVQGIAEPTEGLIAQPVRSMLASWGQTTTEIAVFSALVSIPWTIKPLYGLLTDFVPLAGTRRRSYLLWTTGITILGLGYLYYWPPETGDKWALLALLLLPTMGVAFSDVVVDALMVDRGQPLGLTGLLQSVQWTAMYLATILAGIMGGYLSQRGEQSAAFIICAAITIVTWVLTWLFVKEPPVRVAAGSLRSALAALSRAAGSTTVRAAAAFVFLWSFNPFSTSVLYVYCTKELGLSEQSFGVTVSLLSVGAVLASVAYGTYCRRVPLGMLIYGSIVFGILSTLAYWGLWGETSARLVNIFVGFTYMTGSLVLFDVAARACPLDAAGTTFALLMGLSNLSFIASAALGGWFYDSWSGRWGAATAFNLLVAAGALANCLCFPLVPYLQRNLIVGEQHIAPTQQPTTDCSH